eukprot:TRINITY_DN82302_c0_g1_i1.p2 TRINITY_DN82302_c0_g1~~TRINITY_DN82302_c0_g1_i1.p2  ORF type:complete len:117 (-),score=34.35 TRINITY_DN82302_c0_g1_i1:87-437(-)
MNVPDRSEVLDAEKDTKLEYEDDQAVSNAGTFKLLKEDHTLGNLLRSALLKDPGVIFAGYKQRHPLEPFIEIKVRTKPDYDPKRAFERAIDSAMSEVASLMENLNRATGTESDIYM